MPERATEPELNVSIHINNNKWLLNESFGSYAEHIFVLHGSLFLGNYIEIRNICRNFHSDYSLVQNYEPEKKNCKTEMEMLNDRNVKLSMEIVMEVKESFKNQTKIFERGKSSKRVHLKCDPNLFVGTEIQMKLFNI